MSEIRATTISDAAGTGPIALTGQSAAKAWVHWDGTGTVAIYESFGVSGLVDNATGKYNINMVSSMSSATYAITADSVAQSTAATYRTGSNYNTNTTSLFEMRTGASSGYVDVAHNSASVLGDLA